MGFAKGARVVTPPINGVPVETETTCLPYWWGRYVVVTLAGLPGLWEVQHLRAAEPEAGA